jgi:hypothetical protein
VPFPGLVAHTLKDVGFVDLELTLDVGFEPAGGLCGQFDAVLQHGDWEIVDWH